MLPHFNTLGPQQNKGSTRNLKCRIMLDKQNNDSSDRKKRKKYLQRKPFLLPFGNAIAVQVGGCGAHLSNVNRGSGGPCTGTDHAFSICPIR